MHRSDVCVEFPRVGPKRVCPRYGVSMYMLGRPSQEWGPFFLVNVEKAEEREPSVVKQPEQQSDALKVVLSTSR